MFFSTILLSIIGLLHTIYELNENAFMNVGYLIKPRNERPYL
ncbi:MAG: hypothetical protein RL379_350 [Bacillota bacterium]